MPAVSPPSPVALDAMGGDSAPAEPVRGAVAFARETGQRVLLVGREEDVRRELDTAGGAGLPIDIVPASEVIGFGEKIDSIRRKRDSSIHVGARLVRDGLASAFVSGGHTGALMAVAKVICGVLPGVDRPALPAPIPRRHEGHVLLLDAGANVDCRPEHFRQFAVMGYHFARRVFAIDDPRVALLSIGEEDTKGNDVLQQVSSILRATEINFIGNVEGNDLFTDKADVVVCDGFVGNVSLKMAEGLAEGILDTLREQFGATPVRRAAAWVLRGVFRELKRKLDYAETGGMPLLGLRGVVVVAHGRSHGRAFANALRVAGRVASSGLVARIESDIAALHEAERRLGSEA